ncbi:MAG: glycosyltransferase [Flavisolibacter sp.]|jgi:glycosyltransferase involved in cell wall biosynthesis|nr:glycosyltransferase [Flavisolibacter sp.]
MINPIQFSCVFNVYRGTVLDYFKIALQSLIDQTVQPDELLFIVDGPVYPELDACINAFVADSGTIPARKITNKINLGGGASRNVGIRNAAYEWIAIMDCDDFSEPTRFEKQISVLHQHPEVDFVCTLSDEYDDELSISNYVATKKCPERSQAIIRRLNYNCCITHPTIFFHKRVWETAGGYAEYKFINDDHAFFLKIAKEGFTFHCVQEPLLRVRIGMEQRKRRRGLKLFWADVKFRQYCLKNDLMDFKGFSLLILLFIRRFTPSFMLSYAHRLWRSI